MTSNIHHQADTEVWGGFWRVDLPHRGVTVYVCDDSIDSELVAQQIAELDHDTNPPERPGQESP